MTDIRLAAKPPDIRSLQVPYMPQTPLADVTAAAPNDRPARAPRLGFLGLGWIGRHRLRAVADSGLARIVALADPCTESLDQAAAHATGASRCRDLDELLNNDLDGLVIATPSAQHALQAAQALKCKVAVFCQKPLARTAKEHRQVIECAKQANRLLGVDLSYRYVDGVHDMRQRIRSGELGRIFAAELVFHNAYGPDKPWFYDMSLSGGGCLMDLGIHLIDLAHWILGSHPPRRLDSYLVAQGERIGGHQGQVEDYADVHWETPDGARIRVSCSWRLSAGCDAVIKAAFFGSRGALVLENVNGSFYDLVVSELHGTQRQLVAGPSNDWGGKALLAWAGRLAEDPSYDADVESLVDVAAVLDRSYGRQRHSEDSQ